MSVITQCLRENKKADPYLSWPACDRLHRISQSWSDLVRSNIALEPKQINQMLIMKIDGMNFDGLSCKRNRVIGYRHGATHPTLTWWDTMPIILYSKRISGNVIHMVAARTLLFELPTIFFRFRSIEFFN